VKTKGGGQNKLKIWCRLNMLEKGPLMLRYSYSMVKLLVEMDTHILILYSILLYVL
jgi:hypothetical protein